MRHSYKINKHSIFETVIIFIVFTTELSFKLQLYAFIELEIPNNRLFYRVRDSFFFEKMSFVNIMSS